MSDELIELLQALKVYIQELASDVHVVETEEIFEDEHANLEVYPPLTWTNEQCRKLQRQIAIHAADIHMNTGYLILVYVCTPEQQVVEAQQEAIRINKKLESVEKILAEAEQIGLLKPTSAPTDLVTA